MQPPIDLTSAISFVGQSGTILEKARLLRLLMDVEPSPETYLPLFKVQNPDGGFPSRPKAGSQSAVDSTLTALWQMDELDQLHSPAAHKAVDFLLAMQRPDGGWDENPGLPDYDLPPWIQPGEPGTRLYLSAYAAYWLAIRGETALPAFGKALVYLAANQEPGGGFPGYLHTNWLAASNFLFAGGDYTQRTDRCLLYLATMPFSGWDDSQVAWAIDCLIRAGLPANHSWIQAALTELLHRQAADGSWASEDGPAFAASATVGVLKVLKSFGLLEDV